MAIGLCAGRWVETSDSGAVTPALFLAAATPTTQWRLWVFTGVWVACASLILVYLLAHPRLLLRRLRGGPLAERETSQKIIISLTFVLIAALVAVIGLDLRDGWSAVPTAIALAGDVLVAAALLLVLLVFNANQFAGASVRVEAGQKVISTGPYAFVRHPLYSAGLALLLGIPLALGSWWGLAFYPAFVALIIWRLTDEEKYLMAHLPGYQEYRERVTHRLIPGVW